MDKPRRLLPLELLPRRYGRTRMTVHRWRHNRKLNFPEPSLVVGNREYFDESELELWERASAAAAAAAKPAPPPPQLRDQWGKKKRKPAAADCEDVK